MAMTMEDMENVYGRIDQLSDHLNQRLDRAFERISLLEKMVDALDHLLSVQVADLEFRIRDLDGRRF